MSISQQHAAINLLAFRHPRLRLLHRYVGVRLSARLSLGDAARLVGLSRNYFCEFFHREVGISFAAWLTHCRIEEAKRLLTDERQHIGAVAFAVGYSDLTTFERAFRRHEGVTPRQFRRMTMPTIKIAQISSAYPSAAGTKAERNLTFAE